MGGYEIYRLSDEEILHYGVKGMKWGKRKASYMNAVKKHESKTKANRDKVAAHKAREKEAGKKAFKKGKEKVVSSLNNPKVTKTLNKAVNTATKLYVYNKSLEMFGMSPVPAIKTAGMVAANAIIRQYTNGRVY